MISYNPAKNTCKEITAKIIHILCYYKLYILAFFTSKKVITHTVQM